MRVLVCGGRDYNDWGTFQHAMCKIAEERFPRTESDDAGNYLYAVTIIAGGADGADKLAASWAAIEWSGYEEYKANWSTHGRAGGPIRNQRMLDKGKPNLVIAFPGGRGTSDMVRRAKSAGVEVIEVAA